MTLSYKRNILLTLAFIAFTAWSAGGITLHAQNRMPQGGRRVITVHGASSGGFPDKNGNTSRGNPGFNGFMDGLAKKGAFGDAITTQFLYNLDVTVEEAAKDIKNMLTSKIASGEISAHGEVVFATHSAGGEVVNNFLALFAKDFPGISFKVVNLDRMLRGNTRWWMYDPTQHLQAIISLFKRLIGSLLKRENVERAEGVANGTARPPNVTEYHELTFDGVGRHAPWGYPNQPPTEPEKRVIVNYINSILAALGIEERLEEYSDAAIRRLWEKIQSALRASGRRPCP